MKVLVCGGRNFGLTEKERSWIYASLDAILNPTNLPLPEDVYVIAGKARGVDSVAINWAVDNWCEFREFPADWSLGKKAGFLRNRQMLEEGKPDLVIAFPGGRGTENMKSLARKAGVEVIEVAYPPDEANPEHLSW